MIVINSNVNVRRKNEAGSWEIIHRGRVVEMTSSHARVFSEKEASGDTVPEYAQWFPFSSNCSKLEEAAV